MKAPSEDFASASFRAPPDLYRGLDGWVHGAIGLYRRRSSILTRLLADAQHIDQASESHRNLSDHHLQEELRTYRQVFRRGGKTPDSALISALAAIREAADRRIGLRPFVVQLAGALALYRGYLAEMATGEGKTLTAGLAAVLFGWTGKPCHIVTVNDYLVRRDAEWLRPLYAFAGVKAGFVTAEMPPEERREGYACDLTYTTSKEVVADFLRDGLCLRSLRNPTRRLIRRLAKPRDPVLDRVVMRGLHTAIIDEADSVLIDEAVTPLIISTSHKNETLQEAIRLAQEIAGPLEEETDYRANHRFREIELTEQCRSKLADRCASLAGFWREPNRRLEFVKQALAARVFYRAGKHYVIDQGRIVIVDEFTGRSMPNRTWRQGMHQAIEAKEGLAVTDPSETLSRLSFQRYFRFYRRLAGMTGTAREAAAEFWQIYHLPTVTIPPNRPCLRQEFPDRLFGKEESKWSAIVEEIIRLHPTGRPILIGTRSVTASEKLAARLSEKAVHFRLLNAVRHLEEAQIIADAGGAGKITIATNMAGRGTDIKLGRGVAELGGLHVIATERHESRRIDRQLFGRCARQGDPGSAQAFWSAEDELLQRHLPPLLRTRLTALFSHRSKWGEFAGRTLLNLAQHNAQRDASRQRRGILKMDDWLEEALSFAPERY